MTHPSEMPRTDEAYVLRLLARIADLERELSAARSALREREGMVRVPREPTEKMIVAMGDQLLRTFNCVTREGIIAVYRMLLAAAPSAGGEGKQ